MKQLVILFNILLISKPIISNPTSSDPFWLQDNTPNPNPSKETWGFLNEGRLLSSEARTIKFHMDYSNISAMETGLQTYLKRIFI
jgi:hypothetical protein